MTFACIIYVYIYSLGSSLSQPEMRPFASKIWHFAPLLTMWRLVACFALAAGDFTTKQLDEMSSSLKTKADEYQSQVAKNSEISQQRSPWFRWSLQKQRVRRILMLQSRPWKRAQRPPLTSFARSMTPWNRCRKKLGRMPATPKTRRHKCRLKWQKWPRTLPTWRMDKLSSSTWASSTPPSRPWILLLPLPAPFWRRATPFAPRRLRKICWTNCPHHRPGCFSRRSQLCHKSVPSIHPRLWWVLCSARRWLELSHLPSPVPSAKQPWSTRAWSEQENGTVPKQFYFLGAEIFPWACSPPLISTVRCRKNMFISYLFTLHSVYFIGMLVLVMYLLMCGQYTCI